MTPLTCESTSQKSPWGVDSTRGTRSRRFWGALRVHRSFTGLTCESAEMMRSRAIGRSSFVGSGLRGAPSLAVTREPQQEPLRAPDEKRIDVLHARLAAFAAR